MSKYDITVVVGRFQPVHNGHIQLIKRAAELSSGTVLILLGGADAHPSPKNPFSVEERTSMLRYTVEWLQKKHGVDIVFAGINDTPYAEHKWVEQVQDIIDGYAASRGPDVAIVGHTKDASTYYLDLFPEYDYVEVENHQGLNATDFREAYFSGKELNGMMPGLPIHAVLWLENFRRTPEYRNLVEEWKHIREYRDSWSSAPYEPVFVTVDAVTYCRGHVLMIQRGHSPGKGQWALPGGFIDPAEAIKDGILRELREETRIDIPPAILKNNLRSVEFFDLPTRSLRGRTITFAGLITLENLRESLPRVRAADDAAQAEWVSLRDLRRMKRNNEIYEDHYDIVHRMMGHLDTKFIN